MLHESKNGSLDFLDNELAKYRVASPWKYEFIQAMVAVIASSKLVQLFVVVYLFVACSDVVPK